MQGRPGSPVETLLGSLSRLRQAWPKRGWSWDTRLSCVASSFGVDLTQEARAAAKIALPTEYMQASLRSAPAAVREIAEQTGGLRPGSDLDVFGAGHGRFCLRPVVAVGRRHDDLAAHRFDRPRPVDRSAAVSRDLRRSRRLTRALRPARRRERRHDQRPRGVSGLELFDCRAQTRTLRSVPGRPMRFISGNAASRTLAWILSLKR